MNVKKIWKARNQILEGIKNKAFKSEAVEAIAEERDKICKQCELYDKEGNHCMLPGTQPCCGECGCALSLKQRSLSSACGEGYWEPVLTEEEDMNHEILNPESDE
jgi:hypothetical protein